ncbi:hypothetical protein TTHERM_000458218 (macronuclear) [Tetrahymena thermophila SB210]|uniref:Uncharacterized protein n=1 Tax=Tetrahymena thermophila (strain SB210) TaxID=312017 RepID=W7X6K0_TETTS|nr:hypothetical protein TTHERM_000458218 [Tetrahymena thermophila SB210]EWS71993.1 hypothetical protein TTHERM_000458218 [Tetrahymena thermophila SB210]|eukprot:XP_012655493.1 hypothetical protein TTHERM_000458218 [Tetrahymena thermophila SB210]
MEESIQKDLIRSIFQLKYCSIHFHEYYLSLSLFSSCLVLNQEAYFHLLLIDQMVNQQRYKYFHIQLTGYEIHFSHFIITTTFLMCKLTKYCCFNLISGYNFLFQSQPSFSKQQILIFNANLFLWITNARSTYLQNLHFLLLKGLRDAFYFIHFDRTLNCFLLFFLR